MPYYLLPPISDPNSEFGALVQRAGVPSVHVSKLYDLAKYIPAVGPVFIQIDAPELAILTRHLSTLLPELPSALYNVPGAVYPTRWTTTAAALYPVDWMEVSGKLAKSGLLAPTPERVEKQAGRNAAGDEEFAANFAAMFSASKDADKKATELEQDVGPENEV